MRWQIEDVRAVTVVTSVDHRPVGGLCGFCEQPFQAAWWISLSVARDGLGGTTVDLCQGCAAASWEGLLLRLQQVAEMLSSVDTLHEQAGQ